MEFKCCAKSSREAENIADTYRFLRVVADPNRLRIICLLRKGARCVCEIVPAIGISDKLASHHLKKLKNMGLLTENREGNFIRYGLDKKTIEKYSKIFNQIIK